MKEGFAVLACYALLIGSTLEGWTNRLCRSVGN